MSDLAREQAPPGGNLTFGIGLFTGQHPAAGRPLYRQALELARAAEGNGFDAFWVSEHHGLDDGYLPAPLTLLAAVAARTTAIRLGTALAIAPLYHPIRLAEEAAVVDELSEGRLTLGLGIGYAQHEFAAYGADTRARGARLADLVRLLRTAWGGEPFDWSGPAYSGTGVRVTPAPVQSGGIPIWLGGYAPSAVRRAGDLADGHLIGRGDPDIVEAASAELSAVRTPADRSFTVGVTLLVALSGTPDQDRAVRGGFLHQQSVYERIQRDRNVFAGHVEDSEQPLGLPDVDSYFHAVGDDDEVVEQVRRALVPLSRWANVHVVVRALVPETDTQEQLARIDRLGERILPALRTRQGHRIT